jgi:hypothetical protein
MDDELIDAILIYVSCYASGVDWAVMERHISKYPPAWIERYLGQID